MSTWSPKDPGSTEFFTVDFVRQLAAGDTITSATITCSVLAGVDAAAGSMVSGSAVISGTNVSQSIRLGVAGVHYQLEFSATTAQGETLTFGGDFWALAPFGA